MSSNGTVTNQHDQAKDSERLYHDANELSEKKIGKLNITDVAAVLMIAVAFPWYIFNYSRDVLQSTFNEHEAELIDLVAAHKAGKFYLNFSGAFAIKLLSSLSAYNLRYTSVAFCTGVLFNVYLILRRCGISQVFCAISSLSIGVLPLFQTLSCTVSTDPLFLYLFTLSIYIWNTLRIQNIKCYRTMALQSMALAVVLGLLASTKFLGIVTWVWIMCLCVPQIWNLIADVTLSTYEIASIVTAKFFFIISVPLAIFGIVQYNQLNNWTIDSPEYSQYMSSYFKTYLRGREGIPTAIFYGSIVRIRHLNSLGGYLTSYNMTYPGGSNEQIVAVSDVEDTEWNHWVLEPSAEKDLLRPLTETHHVLLRHKLTHKLLRASSAKPPISEQEYDKEVACTGDINYKGDRDEHWRLETTKLHEPLQTHIKIQLRNIGQSCHALSHDMKLPSHWDLDAQELVCLDPATKKYSTWEINVIKPGSIGNPTYVDYGVDREMVGFFTFDAWKLMFEVLCRQFRYDYLVENFSKTGGKITMWPFSLEGDALVMHSWMSSVVAVMCWVLWMVILCIRANPWSDEKAPLSSVSSQLFYDVSLEYVLGWFLHYYIFSQCKHENLDVVQYLPSYILGELLFALIVSAIYNWRKSSLTVWVVYLSFILYKVRM